MSLETTRRRFLAGTVSASLALADVSEENRSFAQAGETHDPGAPGVRTAAPLPLAGNVALSRPTLADGQLAFRIGLARQRTASYPCDSLDFVMMDLERPDGCSRHAHWCTGDLTGRLLEFLSCADGIDGKQDARLSTLFERILKQRRPSGLFGRFASNPGNVEPESDPWNGANRLFCGLIRYYELTGDARALESAVGVAGRLVSVKDAWRGRLEGSGGRFIEAWVTEPFARLYGHTRDARWLDFCGLVQEHLGTCEAYCHAHGFMSTLRGLQTAAFVTGDLSWNEKPELNRQIIREKRLEMPDGSTPEAFPGNFRNEGCSIADWLMLNLNAGLITGDENAYAKAEHIFWNALAFNQWITGGFGHRGLMANGYAMTCFEEAWWCCVHDAGLAMTEYARHAVTFRDGAIRVNLLVPGTFEVPLPSGATAEVRIETRWPAVAEATICVKRIPENIPVILRAPACAVDLKVTESRLGDTVQLDFTGRIGHRLVDCQPGAMLMYGPLVLAPSTFGWNLAQAQSAADAGVPAGYIPQALPAGVPTFQLESPADDLGFVPFSTTPLPEWSYFDEGPGARCWVAGAAVNVPLKFPNGETKTLRFSPLCYNTSNLTLYETPIVFRAQD